MAISSITFKSGTSSWSVDTPFKLVFSGSYADVTDAGKSRVTASLSDSRVTVSSRLEPRSGQFLSPVLFEHALQAFLNDPANRYVSSINEIGGGFGGAFFIHGSECTGWMARSNAGAMEMYIADMCPPCNGCSWMANVRSWLEFYRIALNGIKDASLYAEQPAASRRSFLTGNRLSYPAPSRCSEELSAGSLVNLQIAAYNLLYEYVTAVQLWNYAATINRNATDITTAPEDGTGFVVRSKFSFPECNEGKIVCTIEVSGVQGNVQTGMVSAQEDRVSIRNTPVSMYVYPNRMGLSPWGDGSDGLGITTDTALRHDTADDTTPPSAFHDSRYPSLHKRITYTTYTNVSGDYSVQAKFMPFMAVSLLLPKKISIYKYVELWSPDGAITAPDETFSAYPIRAKVTLPAGKSSNPYAGIRVSYTSDADFYTLKRLVESGEYEGELRTSFADLADAVVWAGGGKTETVDYRDILNADFQGLSSASAIDESFVVGIRNIGLYNTGDRVAAKSLQDSYSTAYEGLKGPELQPAGTLYYATDMYEKARRYPSVSAMIDNEDEIYNMFNVSVRWKAYKKTGDTYTELVDTGEQHFTYQTKCCRNFSLDALKGIFAVNDVLVSTEDKGE